MNNGVDCKYCRYYSEYNDGKFTFPICTRYSNLKEADEAIKNSDSCELKQMYTKNIERIPITFEQLTESFKNLCDSVQKASNSMTLFANELSKEKNND